ncbi:ATP-binding protein [Pontibacter akesuensis]|uniref:Putative ATP-dependent DNA helicase recG C-terminal n=1 Tax=Pontibacter akesuensis TaxID=388950 RepID=A0A1I7JCH1_9BACT|nr:ATP-binding protein [Pontibacter akesuensis]GHA70963.1 hypothetical protein GCM10007389_25500 [Pontibacter akesuensis]SFU82886.1 Putative ATP-dependent DNA helicase recG C-terminal [Pontibacter akesuensis]
MNEICLPAYSSLEEYLEKNKRAYRVLTGFDEFQKINCFFSIFDDVGLARHLESILGQYAEIMIPYTVNSNHEPFALETHNSNYSLINVGRLTNLYNGKTKLHLGDKSLTYPIYHSIIGSVDEESTPGQDIGYFNITNLGGILFAKNINEFDRLSRKSIRVIIYEGKNKLRTVKDLPGVKGYASGFAGLLDYINDKLPSNEAIGRAFRETVSMYPELAIRELVANALIHQDFYETGTGPMVEIYSDRIEITNPGKPIITTLRFIDEYQSRNETLAAFMRRVGICEEKGSGIDKVISEVELAQLPAPNFQEQETHTKVTVYAYQELNQMDKADKIRACYQHCCLKYVSNEKMTNQSLRDRFNIESHNYSIASRIIDDTKQAGLVKDYDPDNKSKKHAKYVPIWA